MDERNGSIWHGRTRLQPRKGLISVGRRRKVSVVVRLAAVFEDSIVKIQVEGQILK